MQLTIRPEWVLLLNNTNPGHYGVCEYDASVYKQNIWVDIPNRIFNFIDIQFYFILKLGSSSVDDGFQQSFTRNVRGEGRFKFDEGPDKIFIEELKLGMDLDLFI